MPPFAPMAAERCLFSITSISHKSSSRVRGLSKKLNRKCNRKLILQVQTSSPAAPPDPKPLDIGLYTQIYLMRSSVVPSYGY
eukprot:6204840-Pleurochrysis_carterae.AAC.2